MPFIQDTFTDKRWADEGLVVLAIDIGESSSTVKDFVNRYELTLHVLSGYLTWHGMCPWNIMSAPFQLLFLSTEKV